MTTAYPTAIDAMQRPLDADSFIDGSATDGTVVIDNMMDAIEALEAEVGVTGSAVTTSLRNIANFGRHTSQIHQTGDVTATLGANQNDYNPAGLSTASHLRLTASITNVNITGLAGGDAGRLILVTNAGTTNTLTLVNQSSSSTAANRFLANNDLKLGPKQVALLRYDSVATRWEIVAAPAIGGTVFIAGDYQVPTPANAASVANRDYVDTEIAGIPTGFDPADTPAFIQYSGGWPARTTATADSTRMVIWKGPAATPPTIGGAGNAVDGVDAFWGES